MKFEEAIATLGIPGSIAVVMLIIFAVLQLIGELLEAFGKVVPTFLKVRKIFIERRKEKAQQKQTLEEIKENIKLILPHCDEQHISERNQWMNWVNERATTYDNAIEEYRASVDKITEALNSNTKMTEQMFIESSRDRIIDFASKVSNPLVPVSREEYHRIFKVYDKYEAFLADHNMTNGEVDLNYQIITDTYAERIRTHNFIDDRYYSQRTEE